MHIDQHRYSRPLGFFARLIAAGLLLGYAAAPAMAQISVWRADGTTNDSFGVNHGVGTAITYVPDQFGGEAFLFGGSSSVVTIANPEAGGLAKTDGFSIYAWVKPSSFTGTAGGSIFNVRPVANNAGFTFETDTANPKRLKFFVNQGGVFRFVLTEDVLELDKWSHVAATFDAFYHRIRVFVDGKLVASRDDIPSSPMTLSPNFVCEIGRNIVNHAFAYKGAIDNLRYYEGEHNACAIRTFLGLPLCKADRNCDGAVDLEDFFLFFNCFDVTLSCADVDDSGDVDLGDYFEFFNAFDAGC